jgi:hypothetical protein
MQQLLGKLRLRVRVNWEIFSAFVHAKYLPEFRNKTSLNNLGGFDLKSEGDVMSLSQGEQNPLALKAAEARATAARLAKVVQTHAEMLQKHGSLADSSQWPAVWAGAIASGFGKYAFTTDWTGGDPHPWWTAGAHPTGDDWTAWASGTWAGAGQFYEDPKNYFGKEVWANLTCGGLGAGGVSLNLYRSEGGPLIGKFGGYFSGLGGCNITCPLTYTHGP